MSVVQTSDEAQPARQVLLQNSALEILRAALCALSWVSTGQCAPVHFMRIRASCARLGLEASLMEVLAVLEMMREAQEIGGGYWVPTPTRTVPLRGCRLIVSANSTRELERLLGAPIEVAGAGRTVPHDKSLALPEETADNWIGAPIDLRQWTVDIMERAGASLKPTVHPNERVEVFAPWRGPKANLGSRRRRWWCNLEDLSPGDANEILLCRTTDLTGRHWFFAQIISGKITADHAINENDLRLLYGLNLIHGSEVGFTILAKELEYAIVLPLKIPQEERRLLVALGRESEVDSGTMYRFAARYRPAVDLALQRVGFFAR